MAGFPGVDVPMYGYQNQGALPWKSNTVGSFSDPNSITASYNQAYNNVLGMNQSNYQNIMAGYNSAISAQTSAQQAINAGYSGLYNSVMDRLQGQGQSAARRIGDSYSQLLAGTSQQAIDRGLGNTTIQSSINRGVESDKQRALMENDESINKIMADYMSGLGTKALGAQQEGLDRVSGLGLRQLDFMNQLNAKYPDGSMWGELAQMAGKLQGQGQGAGGGAFGGGAFGGGAAPRVGYVPGGNTPGGNVGGYLGGGYGGGGSMGAWAGSPTAGYSGGYGGGGAGGGLALLGSGMEYGGGGGGYGGMGEDAAMSGFVGGAAGGGGLFEDMSYGGGGDF